MVYFSSVRKERSQDNAKDVDLSNWHFHFLTVTWEGEGSVVGEKKQFRFRSVNFHMTRRYPKEDIE